MKYQIKNVINQILIKNRSSIIFDKAKKRFFDKKGTISNTDNLQWIKDNVSNFQIIAEHLDINLWQEAEKASLALDAKARVILPSLDFKMGGGGLDPFLYFVTRLCQPDYVVETGVAAGFSSSSFLSALQKNQHGKLYSSDFPYFKANDPERYIGILVDEELKSNWHLYVDGDAKNLAKIINEIERIDLFHYDSDKSYLGREFAMQMVAPKLHDQSIIFMDDIQDNCHFYDYIKKNKCERWYIFEFKSKYVGLIGDLEKYAIKLK